MNHLDPINADWEELQHMCRQQYSKIGKLGNSYFMHRDPFILMKMQKQ